MKTLLLFLLSCLNVLAIDVELSWEAPATGISGYHVFTGTNSRAYYLTNTISGPANTNVVMLNLVAGKTYYFAVSCTSTGGFDGPISTELVAMIPVAPNAIRIEPSCSNLQSIR